MTKVRRRTFEITVSLAVCRAWRSPVDGSECILQRQLLVQVLTDRGIVFQILVGRDSACLGLVEKEVVWNAQRVALGMLHEAKVQEHFFRVETVLQHQLIITAKDTRHSHVMLTADGDS